jgi:putative transposase
MRLLAATLDGVVVARPAPNGGRQHLCLDAGYDYDAVREQAAARDYEPHIRSRRAEQASRARVPGWRARRWVVERTHSWMNRSRRLLVRWEKKAGNYLAFVQLACAQLVFSKAGVSG